MKIIQDPLNLNDIVDEDNPIDDICIGGYALTVYDNCDDANRSHSVHNCRIYYSN